MDDEPEDDVEIDDESDVSLKPSDTADPDSIVAAKIPKDIRTKYEVFSYRNAAVILSETRPEEFKEILEALRKFEITTTMIRTAGGNESDIPKILSQSLRPKGWHETTIQGDLLVKKIWKQPIQKKGKPSFEIKETKIVREKYIDGHKIDYIKGKVAFDLEWNSKDQTFDRDLYAFNAFSQTGVIDVGILLTRSASLNPIFKELGPSLNKDGSKEHKKSGKIRMTHEKYGASTTWMGKLLYRLNAGRNGSCPVLAVGITPACISDRGKR
ncbi:MAG TPA: BglII/BstYI family type II restriction endonuclease [Patescibacteria group bacterium]|nr:BglII/BstYI family type II restriction endonuclease [Patescibacteria group bacterium]